ncbi:MAG: phosphatidylcholine/phosphatidylserine synthase [Phycisphaeraceae bacterium]|nr:phosphatidylcholine/phosphatidylserine synthase [Phycisphaeraceae bacterium]
MTRVVRPPPWRERVRRRRFRRVPPLSVAPTLLTLGNLLCGFAAIHYAALPIGPSQLFGWSTLTVAGAMIFLAMFFDALDGTVARLTRSASDFGAQLDSLADIVSFGVAPAYMMMRLVSHYYGPGWTETMGGAPSILGPDADSTYGKIIWAIAAIYVSCAALRLARFNIETPGVAEEDHRSFRGLPSPGAGGTVASLIVLHQHLLVKTFAEVAPPGFARASSLFIPLVTILCAGAMVSRIRYAHVVNRYLRGRRSFRFIVLLVVPLVAAILWLQVTMAIAFVLYALSGPWGALMRRNRATVAMAAEASGPLPPSGVPGQPPGPSDAPRVGGSREPTGRER